VCGGEFVKTVTDEEAWDEALDNERPENLAGGVGTTCDDCYHEVMAFMRENYPELLREGTA
jgi:hypothetical protein